ADRDGMPAVHSNGEGKVDSVDRFAAGTLGGAQSADVVGARGGIEGGTVAPKQSHRQHTFGRNSVMVTALPLAHRAGCRNAGTVYHPTCCITHSGQRRTLEHKAV